MEKVNFTLTNLARTVLAVLISFTVGLTGLQAQSYPTVNANGSTACDSANVTTVAFVENDSCGVPTAVSIEFMGGGTSNDPQAFTNHQWQVAFSTSGVSWATPPLPLASFTSTGGGSLKRIINLSEFSLRRGSGLGSATWADSTIGFFVFQICDPPTGSTNLVVAPADTVAPAGRFSSDGGKTAKVENSLGGTNGNTKNMVRIKSSLGGIDSTLCGKDKTSGTSDFITLDPLLGEVDTIWSMFNDAKKDSQTVSICLSAPNGIPNAENFNLEVYEDLNGTPTALFDNQNSTGANGDLVRVDSVYTVNGLKCYKVKFVFDGTGTNGYTSTSSTVAGTNKIIVKASSQIACARPSNLAVVDVKKNDFTASWKVAGGTTGHKFRVVMYQGDSMVTTLGDSKPDTATNWVYNEIFDASALSTTKSDSFVFKAKERYGRDLLSCTTYQIWVAQICDGMNGTVNGPWVGAQMKTWQEDVVITQKTDDAECPAHNGSVTLTIAGGPCTPKIIQVFMTDTLSYWQGKGDTARWYSVDNLNGVAVTDSAGFASVNGNITFTQDSLKDGNYNFIVVVSDTTKPDSTYSKLSVPVVINTKDTEGPTARIHLEDVGIGASYEVTTVGLVKPIAPSDTLVNSVIQLGELIANDGDCSVDLDFLLTHMYDTCVTGGFLKYYGLGNRIADGGKNLTVSVTDTTGDVEGNVYQGVHDSTRSVNVRVGAGAFAFSVAISDGTNTNKFKFAGSVKDETKPVVTVPGNTVYQIPECATTTDVYFTVQAEDACDGTLSLSAGNVSVAGLTATYVSNGMFQIKNVAAGPYTATVSGVQDAAGNTADTRTFQIVVNASGDIVPRQIVGAGNIVATIPACVDATGVTFDLFIVDECAAGASFSSVSAGGYLVTGALTGNRFSIEGVGPGESITVTAASGSATYSFTITTQKAAEDSAPDITLPGNLTFTLPDCSVGEEVEVVVYVDDDCATQDFLADNILISLQDGEGNEVAFESDRLADVNGQLGFVVSFTVTPDLDGGALFVSTTDGVNEALTISSAITVIQEDAATNFVCQDDLNVTLDGGCDREITPSMVLKGDNGGTICNDLYDVIVEKLDTDGKFVGYTENKVEAGDRGIGANNKRRYMVFNARNNWNLTATSKDFVNTGNMICWGYLTIEDKTKPVIVCPENTTTATRAEAYYAWTGSLTTASPDFQPAIFSCYQSTTPTPGGAPVFTPYVAINEPHHYATFTFAPAVSGKYTITVTGAGFDASMALFQQNGAVVTTGVNRDAFHHSQSGKNLGKGWFDVDQPCSNIVAFGESVIDANDNGGFGNEGQVTPSWDLDNVLPQQRMSLPLNGDREYTLLVTSRDANAIGSFRVEFERDGADAQVESNYLASFTAAGGGRRQPSGTPSAANAATVAILKYWDVKQDGLNNASSSWKNYASTGRLDTRALYCDDINQVLITPANFGLLTKFDYENCYTVNSAGVVVAGLHPELQKRLFYTGYPTVTDNCGDIVVCVSDVVTKQGDCDQQFITRTFTARDVNGNVADLCTQRINFAVPQIADLSFPHYTQYVECDDADALGGANVDQNGRPSPHVTGYPFMQSAFGYHDLAPEWCNLAATYSDEAVIPGCEGSYKLRREWTILDWCRPGNSVVYNQLIKVGDFTAPVMDMSSLVANNTGLERWDGMLTYSVSPFDCDADFTISYPDVVDNCSDWIDIRAEIQEWVVTPIFDHFGNNVGNDGGAWYTIREGLMTNRNGLMVRGIAPTHVGTSRVRTYRFRFTASDKCGNTSTGERAFDVRDLVEPVSVCDDQFNVTLGGASFDVDNALAAGGYARMYKQDLQEGIWDNCEVASYRVRRKGQTTWPNSGEYVEFFCGDVGTVQVELEVTDISGNTSYCWLTINVEDKTRPVCNAPVDVTTDCTTLPADFNPPANIAEYNALSVAAKNALHAQLDELFGAAEILDNCNSVTPSQSITKIEWHCNSGTITRRFSGVDGYGNTTPAGCEQVIVVTREHDYSFTLPKDELSAQCKQAYEVFDVNPVVSGCDLISVYTSDKQFAASGQECYKLFRTFEIVNWCQFKGDDLSVADPFIIERNKVRDTKVTDKVMVNANIVVTYTEILENNSNTDYLLVGTSSDNDQYYKVRASDIATGTGAGYYQYTQVISVYDNDAPVVTATVEAEYCAYAACEVSVVIPISVTDVCTPNDVSVQAYVWPGGNEAAKFAITASLATGTASGTLPIGNHKLEVVGFDGCGNSNRVVEDLIISDCKAPSPTCISGIAVELMPVDANGDGAIDGGSMTIFVQDYVKTDAFEACSNPVKYSIHLSREPETAGELSLLDQIEQFVVNGDMELGDLLNQNQTSAVVTCADAGKTLMAVIAAWDGAGNGDYCETFLIVQDNMNLCGGGSAGPAVAGLISTETNNTVENVEVNLSGQMTDNLVTSTDGNYTFINLQSGYDYTITPLLDSDHDNGVTTFDLIEIGKHILTVKPLGSPYKMIAADVDNNRSITTLDLIQLRRLILSVDTEFANNTSWRFVDASYQFPNPTNPWATSFPEIININDLEGSELSGDFVAIKVGDVTLDARANSLMSGARSVAGTFGIDVAEVAMKAGGEYTVAFNASNLADISGYQFTLNLDEKVALVDINYGVAVAENFGTRFVSEGAITTSWNGNAEAGMLFELVLRAKADVQLSEVVDVTSRYTVAEAYNANGQLLDVAINFNAGATASSVELMQNTPNPFKGETVIGFNLPEAASATLTITDVTGKVLRVVRGDYARGYNQVNLNSAQLPSTGVLYYTLETGDFTATKKMIILE